LACERGTRLAKPETKERRQQPTFNHGKPLLDKPVNQITDADVEKALMPLRSKYPHQARLALAMWASVFTFAKAHKLLTGDNPADWNGNHRFKWPKTPKAKHFDALPHKCMPEFMNLLRQKQGRSPAAVALEFCILTASRISEVCGMQWEETDPDEKLWIIPAERTKANREHRVPLSDRAYELLSRQREYHDCGYANGSNYVFPGARRNKSMDPKTPLWVLRTIAADVTVHGMRSTFRDWAGDMTHHPRNHIEECLAHRVGSATEQSYRHGDAPEKRRVIMQQWADYCAGRGGATISVKQGGGP
jgi:integrase